MTPILNENHSKFNFYASILIAFGFGFGNILDLTVQIYARDIILLQPAGLSQFQAFIFIPWILKPLFGFLTDLHPIFCYRRKSYLLINSLLGLIMLIFLRYLDLPVILSAISLFLVNVSNSFSSVIGEALIIEISQYPDSQTTSEEKSKEYISLFYFFRSVGTLLSTFSQGFLIEWFGVMNMFLFSTIFPFTFLIATFLIYETRIDNGNQDQIDSHQLFLNDQKVLFSQFFQYIQEKSVFIPFIFMILLSIRPDFSNTIFYFLSKLNFSPSELGLIEFFSILCILFVNSFYRVYLKSLNFKMTITVGTFLTSTAIFMYFLFVLRFNLKIGISDYVMAISCNCILNGFTELIQLPLLALGCQLCPKNLEATAFSFFVSGINLGILLTSFFSITSSNFNNLPNLITVVNLINVFPLILLFITKSNYFSIQKSDSDGTPTEKMLKEKLLDNFKLNQS